MRARRHIFATTMLSAMAACNAVSGVGDLRFTGSDDDAPTTCPVGFSCGAPTVDTVVLALDQECPPGWTETDVVYDGTDPGCGNCTCTASGGLCGALVVTKWTVSTCAMALGTEEPETCVDLVTAGSGYSAEPPAQIANAACSASGGSPLPLTGWRLCASSTDDAGPCTDGQVCVPDDPQGACIIQEHGTCPAGAPVPSSVYRAVDDGRTCSCSCSASTCTGVTFELYELAACGGSPVATFPANGMCMSTAGLPSVQAILEAGTGKPTCDPVPLQTGGVTFSDATKLCCPANL